MKDRTVSHFRILSKIGEGGMGIVYKAQDERLRRTVALKILPPDRVADQMRRHRFLREARAAAAVSHPSIAAIYEVGEEDGVVFIAMEYVEGRTLRYMIGEPVPVRDAVRVASDIAEALARAHQVGVIHRDLKPENVMLQPDGRVKILDFGVAKLLEQASDRDSSAVSEQDTVSSSNITLEGTVLGTAAYMSPEQARGRVVDARSDLFSLGVLLYEMVTGRNPFRRSTPADTMGAILMDRPPSLFEANPDLPRGLSRVLEKLFAKHPEDRYASADALLEDLRTVKSAMEKGQADPPPPKAARSIAVLPFADMSEGGGHDYLCEGMAEDLINALSKVEGLRVAARTSAFQFRGKAEDVRRIGDLLDVDAVLEGSVRRVGKKLRVTAQLVSAADGYQLWSDRYDRDIEDVFAIQDEIVSTIVGTLKVTLGVDRSPARVARHTDNLEAYDFYLRGRYYWNTRVEGGLREALASFEKAIEKDPAYAPAHAGVADSYCILGTWGFVPPGLARTRARTAAERALAIDSTLAEAHAALGYVRFFFEWDWEGGEQCFRRSLALHPAYVQGQMWYALLLSFTGRHDEAFRLGRRALELDPLSQYAHAVFGGILYGGRRFEEAIQECHRALEMGPDTVVALVPLGRSCSAVSRHDEAVAALQEAAQRSGRAAYFLGLLGSAYALAGRRDEALALVAELQERAKTAYVMPLSLAWIFMGLGEKDQAFEWLEKAHAEGDPFLSMASVWAIFDPLRSDPRFDDLLRRMRLAP